MRKTVPALKAFALVTFLALLAGCAASAASLSSRAKSPAAVRAVSPPTPGAASPPAAGAASPPVLESSTPAPTAVYSGSYPSRPDVQQFISLLVNEHGFDAAALSTLFAGVKRSDDTIRLMSPAPSGFKKSWKAYRARFIDSTRIAAGVRFWDQNAEAVRRASQRYGVPEEIIVAIIGVETVYGRVTGNHRTIDVLTTLAFDYPRRAEYFRGELEQYLLLTRQERIDPFSMRGSYAGAVGLPQFMPTSIRRWAVDFDQDGKIDLRDSPADAIGSVANFLADHGWARGEPLRYRALIAEPERLAPLIEAGITPAFTAEALRAYGVHSADPVSADARLALIDLPNGDEAPDYWLGGQNFFVITRYNRSSFYAMSVIELASALRQAHEN